MRQRLSWGWCFSAFGWLQVMAAAYKGREGKQTGGLSVGNLLSGEQLCSHWGKSSPIFEGKYG